MKKYREILERAIDFIVKEYETQKEYKEFLRLLKYFVDVQEMKEESVHIVGIKMVSLNYMTRTKKTLPTAVKKSLYKTLIIKTLIMMTF